MVKAPQRYEQALFEYSNEPIFLLDSTGIVLDINPVGRALLEISGDITPIAHFTEFVRPEERSSVFGALGDVRSGRMTVRVTVGLLPSLGDWQATIVPLLSDEIVQAMYVIAKPIVAGSVPLAAKGETFQVIEHNLSDFIAVLDTQGTIVYASPSHERIFGIPATEILGKNAIDLVHPDDVPFVTQRLSELFSQQVYEGPIEVRYQNSVGEWMMTEIRGNPILQGDRVTSIVIVAREVSRRKQSDSLLEHMAYHDLLTALPNRQYFREQVESLMRQDADGARQISLMMLDLDGFKWVNDTHGHAVGDELLRSVAQLLADTVGTSGFVCRLGGDEFVVVVPDHSWSDVRAVAEQILHAFRRGVRLHEKTFVLTTSIGISGYPVHGVTVDEILGQADRALYDAKDMGKNQYAIAEFLPTSVAE